MSFTKILVHSSLCCVLILSSPLLALTIGSDTVPSRQAFVTFPTGAAGNTILGAAAMDGGFALADSLTTVSFNSYFPVNSTITLNNGTILLAMDLNLTSSCDLPTTGKFTGYGYSISWAPHIGTLSIPSTVGLPGALYINNANITFNAFTQLQAPLYFTGVCTLDGQGYTMNLGSGSINVTDGSSLLIQNMTIKGLSNSNIVCLDSQATVSFDQVTCQLSANYTFSQGQLALIGDTFMTGTYAFIYTTTKQSTIYSGATWYFDSGMTFSYIPASGATNLLNFQNSEATLYFYETSLYAPSTGLSLTKGTLTVQGNCPVYSDALSAANGIILGDGVTTSSDMSLNILPESGLQIVSGYLVNNNV